MHFCGKKNTSVPSYISNFAFCCYNNNYYYYYLIYINQHYSWGASELHNICSKQAPGSPALSFI